MSGDDPYAYPGSGVLMNRFGIKDADRLDYVEREIVAQRTAQGLPVGAFDLAHIRAIHSHLFQDLYTWAGELRTVEISKGGHQFQFRQYIATGMADVHRRLVQADFLRRLNRPAFAIAAGPIMGDVNYVHPFRDGNGRAQLQYLWQMAARAGHALDLSQIDPQGWLDASQAAHAGDYGGMVHEIERMLGDPD